MDKKWINQNLGFPILVKIEKLLIVIIIMGFIINIYKKNKEFGKKFNLLKFFFNKNCNNKM